MPSADLATNLPANPGSWPVDAATATARAPLACSDCPLRCTQHTTPSTHLRRQAGGHRPQLVDSLWCALMIVVGPRVSKYQDSRCVLLYLFHDQSASTHNSTGTTTTLKNLLVTLKFNQSIYNLQQKQIEIYDFHPTVVGLTIPTGN